jgi:hypothetical protein
MLEELRRTLVNTKLPANLGSLDDDRVESNEFMSLVRIKKGSALYVLDPVGHKDRVPDTYCSA